MKTDFTREELRYFQTIHAELTEICMGISAHEPEPTIDWSFSQVCNYPSIKNSEDKEFFVATLLSDFYEEDAIYPNVLAIALANNNFLAAKKLFKKINEFSQEFNSESFSHFSENILLYNIFYALLRPENSEFIRQFLGEMKGETEFLEYAEKLLVVFERSEFAEELSPQNLKSLRNFVQGIEEEIAVSANSSPTVQFTFLTPSSEEIQQDPDSADEDLFPLIDAKDATPSRKISEKPKQQPAKKPQPPQKPKENKKEESSTEQATAPEQTPIVALSELAKLVQNKKGFSEFASYFGKESESENPELQPLAGIDLDSLMKNKDSRAIISMIKIEMAKKLPKEDLDKFKADLIATAIRKNHEQYLTDASNKDDLLMHLRNFAATASALEFIDYLKKIKEIIPSTNFQILLTQNIAKDGAESIIGLAKEKYPQNLADFKTFYSAQGFKPEALEKINLQFEKSLNPSGQATAQAAQSLKPQEETLTPNS